ncbi:16S rRNA (adenine(1518)-N(6)/adenine(1519)-N(6))-dimethyltransferase RsmA [Planctomycetota bacterium]
MQTKHEIQQLLAAAGTRPNKRLGQNFLIDLNLMRLLVDSADIHPHDVVLEVGCGTGSLTQALAERAGRVVVAEYDSHLAPVAQAQLANQSNTRIFNVDILASKHALNPEIIAAIQADLNDFSGRFLLVANLPYHVACPVMSNLILQAPRAHTMTVTVQKEVADRLIALPGSHHYGTLSILLAATGEVQRLRVLKPSVFWPQPQIDSAMIRFERHPDRIALIIDMRRLVSVVELFMQHRRKMLKASARAAQGDLAQVDWAQAFACCQIDPMSRPEEVTPEQFVSLANFIAQSRS